MPLMDHPEEDRFIRGLAASPEDEALRLVYADWLEENDHAARSTYMRKEVEHFRDPDFGPEDDGWPWVTHCDPVWLAMVSRPPFGILVPRLTFSDGGPPATSHDLRRIEEHWGASLPADYAAFLLLHNGGNPNFECLTWDNPHTFDSVVFYSTAMKSGRYDWESGLWREGDTPYLLLSIPEVDGRPAGSVHLGRFSRTIPIGQVHTSFDVQSGQTVTLGLDLLVAEQQILVLASPGEPGGPWFIDDRLCKRSFATLLNDLIPPYEKWTPEGDTL